MHSVVGVAPPKNPMVGSFPACCARAASGHAAAAPPSSVMNSRLPMPSMGTSSPEVGFPHAQPATGRPASPMGRT